MRDLVIFFLVMLLLGNFYYSYTRHKDLNYRHSILAKQHLKLVKNHRDLLQAFDQSLFSPKVVKALKKQDNEIGQSITNFKEDIRLALDQYQREFYKIQEEFNWRDNVLLTHEEHKDGLEVWGRKKKKEGEGSIKLNTEQ